jgi:hypothetical protein
MAPEETPGAMLARPGVSTIGRLFWTPAWPPVYESVKFRQKYPEFKGH